MSVTAAAATVCVLSHLRPFGTPWTVAHQVPLFMGFSRQEYWSGLPFPSPGIFPTQGWNLLLLRLLHWHADSLPLCHLGSPMYQKPSFTILNSQSVLFHQYPFLPHLSWSKLSSFWIQSAMDSIAFPQLACSGIQWHLKRCINKTKGWTDTYCYDHRKHFPSLREHMDFLLLFLSFKLDIRGSIRKLGTAG